MFQAATKELASEWFDHLEKAAATMRTNNHLHHLRLTLPPPQPHCHPALRSEAATPLEEAPGGGGGSCDEDAAESDGGVGGGETFPGDGIRSARPPADYASAVAD